MSASALADISKHTAELAQSVVDAGHTGSTPHHQVVDAGAVSLIARELGHSDSGLKRQVCSCLGQVAKHNVDLAEVFTVCTRVP